MKSSLGISLKITVGVYSLPNAPSEDDRGGDGILGGDTGSGDSRGGDDCFDDGGD